jgi:hypothetical protein
VQKKLDSNRQRLYEEYEDSLFRLAVYDAAEKEGILLNKENEKLKEDSEYIPSQFIVRKFKRRLNSYYRKHLLSQLHIMKTINKIAVVVLVVLFMFTTAMVTASAFRTKVLNFIINMEEKYTSFRLKGDQTPSGEDQLKIEWTNSYAPTYVPEGYEVSNDYFSDTLKKLIFSTKQNENSYILYAEYSSSNSLAVDTEQASLVETVKINDTTGTAVTKGSLISIIWEMDSHMFVVEGTVGTEELIKIAESIKFLK